MDRFRLQKVHWNFAEMPRLEGVGDVVCLGTPLPAFATRGTMWEMHLTEVAHTYWKHDKTLRRIFGLLPLVVRE